MPLGAVLVNLFGSSAAPATPDFEDDFTGTNGASWDGTNWNTASTSGTSTVTIQSNQGELDAVGASYAYAGIGSNTTTFADFTLTFDFTFGVTGEQYFTLLLRADTYNGQLSNGYELNIYDDTGSNAYDFTEKTSASGTLLTSASDKTWGTGTWHCKVHLSGSTLQARLWQGATEPGTWDLDTTDANHSSGLVGMYMYNGATSASRPISIDNLELFIE